MLMLVVAATLLIFCNANCPIHSNFSRAPPREYIQQKMTNLRQCWWQWLGEMKCNGSPRLSLEQFGFETAKVSGAVREGVTVWRLLSCRHCPGCDMSRAVTCHVITITSWNQESGTFPHHVLSVQIFRHFFEGDTTVSGPPASWSFDFLAKIPQDHWYISPGTIQFA